MTQVTAAPRHSPSSARERPWPAKVQPDSRRLAAWRSLWATLLQPTAPEGCDHDTGTNTAEDEKEERAASPH